jgi:hypothetical protein
MHSPVEAAVVVVVVVLAFGVWCVVGPTQHLNWQAAAAAAAAAATRRD